jgi:hypothetical protein
MQKSTFKIVERTKDECKHDTGVCHSPNMKCKDAEEMSIAFAIREDDPDHDCIWHGV